MSDRPILTLKKRTPKPKPKPKLESKPKPKIEPKPKPKIEPKPKPKIEPKPDPKPLDESCKSKAKRADKYLSEKYDMWAKYLPFEIGLGKVILYKYKGDFSWNSMRLVLSNHVRKAGYLNNIVAMEHRYNLDGKATGNIEPKDKKYAANKLKKLSKPQLKKGIEIDIP